MTGSKELFLLAASKKDAFAEFLRTSDNLNFRTVCIIQHSPFQSNSWVFDTKFVSSCSVFGQQTKRGNPRRKKSRSLVKGDRTRKKYRINSNPATHLTVGPYSFKLVNLCKFEVLPLKMNIIILTIL